MSSLNYITNIGALDPQLFMGTQRLIGGVVRTLIPTLDTPYFVGDSTNPEFMRWIYVGVSGSVTYVQWDGTTQVVTHLAAGVWHPICSTQINTTGTTATSIVVGS